MDIENHETKSKLDIKKNKQAKELKPATVGVLKIARIMIWSVLTIIMLVGVLQIVRGKQPKIIKNTVEYNISPVEGDTAKAFAVSFVKEYLTYDNTRQDDYRSRIEPFLSGSVRSGAKIEVSKGNSVVIDAIAWNVEKLNKEHSNIIVRAEVEQTNKIDTIKIIDEQGKFTEKPKVSKKVIYINVPIGYYSGGFLVEDYPSFVSEPKKPEDPLPGPYTAANSELDDVKVELKGVLDNFFKTYATGNEGQIAYYMDNNKSVKGYEGKYLFESIQTLEAYKEGNLSVVVTQVAMKDAELQTVFTQRYVLKMRKGDGNRWYIVEFSPRGNIYKDEGGSLE